MIFYLVDIAEKYLRPLFIIAFLAGIYGFGLQLNWMLGRPPKPNAFKHWLFSSIVFASFGCFELFAYHFTGHYASKAVHELITVPVVSVSADNKIIANPTTLIENLYNITKPPEHEPSHTRTIMLRIKNTSKEFLLSLKRDSKYANQYWVYYQFPDSSRLNYIGQITTNQLDQY